MTPTTAQSESSVAASVVDGFDVEQVRQDFPILGQRINGRPLVYLDNAATTQKPQVVLDALMRFYTEENANIHRGVHTLSVRATDAYEHARAKLQDFINAAKPQEIVLVRSTTEAINLVCQTFGRKHVGAGDEVIISTMEHHSNIVPWQILCEQQGANLRVIPINDRGELMMDEYERLLGPRTKLVSVAHVSNALGTINPVREIIELAHKREIPVFLDGAQAVPHMKVDVAELDCDFFAFSSHKLFGPTGVGVLYGKADLLDSLPPYQGGGDMIKSVTMEKTIYNDLPYKFEAGTPNIAGGVAFGAAVDYLNRIGMDEITLYEQRLLAYGTKVLCAIPQVRLIGTAANKASILSFVVEGVHAHDVGTILDQQGIAVRTGHHCAQPVMHRFGLEATARASLAFYNTAEEIDALGEGIRKVVEVFA